MLLETLAKINRRHARFMDSLTEDFHRALLRQVSRAQLRTIRRLTQITTDERGRIVPNAMNRKLVATADELFLGELEKQGLPALLTQFTRSFPQQIPFFEETLEAINETLARPLPAIKLLARDERAIEAVQLNSQDSLRALVKAQASRTERTALLQVGAAGLDELTDALADGFMATMPQARTLAETSMSMYYRTVSERSYDFLERKTGREQLYLYQGPADKLTRPFCIRLLKLRQFLTRRQIDALDNESIPGVFLSAGGFNCRHHWILAGWREGGRDFVFPELR